MSKRRRNGPATVKTTSRLCREESGERVAVYLPPELAGELGVHPARKRWGISNVVTETVRAWLLRVAGP